MKSTTLANRSIEIDKNAQSTKIEIDPRVKLLDRNKNLVKFNCLIKIDKNAQTSKIKIDHLVKLLDFLLQLLTMNARQVHSARSVFDLLLQRRVVGRNYFGEFLKVLNVRSGFSVCCTQSKRYD